MDGARMPFRAQPSFTGVACLEHGVAVAPQDLLGHAPHVVLVFDEQYRFRTLQRRRFRGLGCEGVWPIEHREVQAKRGARARLAVNPDVAAALFDDAEYRRKPKSRPFAELLGRIEGLEDASLGLARHANAGIADGEQDVEAWSRAQVFRRVRL